MRRSEQLINVTNVDDEDDHDDYNVDVGNCAEDFHVSDEPAISSSVSLNTRHYERLQRAQDAWAKLRQAALSTTFQKDGSFVNSNRGHQVTSVTQKVAFVVAWTVVQQQSFVNFVLHRCTPK